MNVTVSIGHSTQYNSSIHSTHVIGFYPAPTKGESEKKIWQN